MRRRGPPPVAARPWTFEGAAQAVARQDWAGAREAYAGLMSVHPGHGGVLCNLGLIEQQLHNWPEALRWLDEASLAQPEVARPFLLRADLHKRCGRLLEALADYDRALDREPHDAHAHANRANTLHALHRHEGALEALDRALTLDPQALGVHYNRGNVLRALGRHERAVDSYDRALEQDGSDGEAQFNRGLSLGALGRWQDALDATDRVLALAPEHARAHGVRGDWLKNLGRPDDALEAYRRALALDPKLGSAHLNCGNTLRELGHLAQALVHYDAATALSPLDWEAHYNRGIAFHDLRQLQPALACYARALQLKPDEAQVRWNRALALLLDGQWEEGWRAYESRWSLKDGDSLPAATCAQRWTGLQPLEGATILLTAEQGLGDTLQFCRYAHLVSQRGARVTLLAPPALCSLLASLGPSVSVVSQLEPAQHFDFHCPLMSLPLALGLSDPRQISSAAYLQAPAGEVQSYGDLHRRSGLLRVGVAWSGNPNNRSDAGRSLPLERFRQALPSGLEVVVLQNLVRGEDEHALCEWERQPGPRGSVRREPGWLEGFARTAAVCAHLDLIVTVDTSIAHLAGALGRPVWILLHQGSDWRWQLQGSASDWYASARLFRQEEAGGWTAPLQAVRRELLAMMG